MLLDTSGLLCLHHRAESHHADAVRAYQAAPAHLTHNYILAEYVALAQARALPRLLALRFVADLLANPDIEVVWVDRALHGEAIRLLLSRLDKTYSLCDAVSFILTHDVGRTVSDGRREAQARATRCSSLACASGFNRAVNSPGQKRPIGPGVPRP